ncbi:carbohydrate ABC transporter permease [Actinacidiphila acidipaludis]|uniref:Carbohydrate ABC transporter permease n=1 Tax=Actinacidiphila acidipaludis TaxID=2873382 RepID=A0ABS7Q933_9ACTN|nr:carbohydrate ABC transporter permease [Streptomyces acidipaludis]MBY8879668.1 carbohydrate ABC transporter permease [Streptomyces acidipaludis]
MAVVSSPKPRVHGERVRSARERRVRTRSRRRTERIVVNTILLLIAVLFLVPLAWLVMASLNGTADLRVRVPHPMTLDNFHRVLNADMTYRPILNGLILCGGATALCVVCAVLAAYPLSRYESRYKRPFLLTILFTTGLPITAVMVPVYAMFVQVNLIDTMYGTILFLGSSALPFAIWLTKNFMDGVPLVLEEAAWTDGASSMQTLRRVVLPLMWPGITVVTIFTFLSMWGNFFVPFFLLLSPDQLPASVSILNFFSSRGTVEYGQLAAFSLLYSAPVVVLYAVMSKVLGGSSALGGALKG